MAELVRTDAIQLASRRAGPSPAALYLARLAPGSRRATAQRLGVIVELAGGSDLASFPFERLEYQHVALIRTRLAESGRAPATCNAILAALRGVVQEAWRLGLMSAEQRERIRDIEPIRGSRTQRGRALSPAELMTLLNGCTHDPERTSAGVRDEALIAVLFGAGVRRSEIVGLDVADYDRAEASFRIRGKGNKERVQYLPDFATERLERWLALVPGGPIFRGIHRSGRIQERRLSDQAVRQILRRRSAHAGIADCSPHDLRRTYISELLDRGVDIATVQKMAGHSQVTTTATYDRRGERTRKAAVQTLQLG